METITELMLKHLSVADVGRRLREQGNLLGKVRVDRAGGIIVAFEYRYRSGERIRSISVGTWPHQALRTIRKQRDAYRVDVDLGRDPIETKRAIALAARADQAESLAREQARLDLVAAEAARMTVNELFDRWEKLALKSRKDGGAEVRRMFAKDVLPALGGLAVEDVKKRHVAAMLDKTMERGVGRMANMLLSLTRQMFRFAVSRDWIDADPTATLRKADFGGKEVERDRYLTEEEIRELFRKLPDAKFSKATQAALLIMLSTGCRVGEMCEAKWCDLELTNRTWRIPPDVAKNRHEHVISLSDFAAAQFEVLQSIQTSPIWIFPARSGESHLDEKTIAKQVHDRQRATRMTGRSKRTATLTLPRGPWTPHDLRRTAATLMGELGVHGDIIEKCINHLEPNRMRRIYQRQISKAAKAEAWRLLGDRLELLARTDCDNVVPIPAPRFGQP